MRIALIAALLLAQPALAQEGSHPPPVPPSEKPRADGHGVTPLIDTTGNSIPDTGPIAAGASYTVIVKAALPAGATGGPFNATITATSTAVGAINAGANASMIDRLVAITASTIDLTNNAALGSPGVLGVGPGPEASPVVTVATNPGTTATFTLYVNNTSGASVADTYDLVASSTTTFGAASTLPPGWSVTFHLSLGSDCSAANLGTVVSNTGVVNGGTAKLINPQAAFAFQLDGADSHHLDIRVPPSFASAEQAAEMAEVYWMGLTRDVPFEDYTTDPAIAPAAANLSSFSDFHGPKVSGRVTPAKVNRSKSLSSKRTRRYGHAPIFSGSSWTQKISLRFG